MTGVGHCAAQSLAMPGFGTIVGLPRHNETEAEAYPTDTKQCPRWLRPDGE
jgi:hypothetical protein